jgi:group I intron endonuclease
MQTETQINSPYGWIYRLTNKINGKMYHGQTIQNVDDRWKRYKYLHCKSQPKLYNALKKYGVENFLFETIDSTPKNQFELDNLETHYITKHNSIKNGYNCNPGGHGGQRSEETKRKISNTLKGFHHSIVSIEKIRIAALKHRHSEETKRKLSENWKQHHLSSNAT